MKQQKYKDQIFLYIKTQIEKDTLSVFLKSFLLCVSFSWRGFSSLKNFLYDHGWFRSKKVSSVVVSVGNIVVGGTGKTPLMAILLEKFFTKKICLLTRGYRSQMENKLYTFQNVLQIEWNKVGDETACLAKRYPHCLFVVGKKRMDSISMKEVHTSDILFLDDGFQKRKMHKDFEIVTMNGKDPFGKNHFLPRGFLRDSPKQLKRASLICVNNVKDEKHFFLLKEKIEKYTTSPIVAMRPKITRFLRINDGKEVFLSDEKVAAFCSVGDPSSFYNLLEKQKLDVVDTMTGLDHQSFSIEKIDAFAERNILKEAKFLLCTEKDAIKIPQNASFLLPIIYCEMHLEFLFQKFQFDFIIEKILYKVNNKLL